MESGILGFRIQYKAQGIGDPANDRLESGIQIPMTEIRNPWRGIQNPILYGFSYVGRDIKKKFKGVAHSSENTSSRFCLKVLKLLIWTDSIYFNANLTLSFVGLSKDRFCRSNFEQTFSLNESYFVLFYITCLIHDLGLRVSSLFWGIREKSRESGHEFEGLRRFLARSLAALSFLTHSWVKKVSMSNELE